MTKTIENLKAAITGESTASATYAAYAAKAAQEGQPLIQKLFEAASKAESVHAANHNNKEGINNVVLSEVRPDIPYLC